MSFWSTSEGEDVSTNATGEFDAGGGKIEVIPDGTSVLAIIDEAKWDKNKDNDRYISLRWTVIAPEPLKNRKVFQKLWVEDDDPGAKDPVKKRDKAKRMLAAIDTNAGGKLMLKPGKPTDETLTMCLTNKPMVARVMVWEQMDRSTGGMVQGNWIGAVSPKTNPVSSSEEVEAGQAKMAEKPKTSRQEIDDEIPF
jgi:hypothetical protein